MVSTWINKKEREFWKRFFEEFFEKRFFYCCSYCSFFSIFLAYFCTVFSSSSYKISRILRSNVFHGLFCSLADQQHKTGSMFTKCRGNWNLIKPGNTRAQQQPSTLQSESETTVFFYFRFINKIVDHKTVRHNSFQTVLKRAVSWTSIT